MPSMPQPTASGRRKTSTLVPAPITSTKVETPAYFHKVPQLKGVYAIALNRPKSRNAISKAMLKDLAACLDQAMAEPSLSVLILHSSSDLAFCAGADLVERRTMSNEEVIQFLDSFRDVLSKLEGGRSVKDGGLSVPTICAIDGPALGGGLEMALACDFRVCATHVTKLGFPETRLGIIPGAGGTQRAPRVIGLARAKEMIFTGRTVGAVEGKEMGLIDHLAEPGSTAYERALRLAEEIAGSAPLALKAAKVALSHDALHFDSCCHTSDGSTSDSDGSLADHLSHSFYSETSNFERGLDCERHCYESLLGTRDRVEALEAWREGRKPRWKGE